jgi:CRISPR/Cas system endoribonuclease Cas6 (RAMP superfamily)
MKKIHPIENEMVYIGGSPLLEQKIQDKNKMIQQDIDYKMNQKEQEITTNIYNIYEDFNENIDELAMKIFKNIKDEISMEYKRI